MYELFKDVNSDEEYDIYDPNSLQKRGDGP